MIRRSLVSGAVAAVVLAAANAAASPGGASSVLLRRTDLGSGWSASAAPKSKPSLTCPGYAPSLHGVAKTAAVLSPTFSDGSAGPFISQAAFAFATPSQQAVVWRKVVRRGLVSCFGQALVHGSTSGIRFAVTSEHELRAPRLAVAAAAYRVSGTASQPGQSVDVYEDVIVVGHGALVSTISLLAFEQPVDRGLELRLARIVARRLSAG